MSGTLPHSCCAHCRRERDLLAYVGAGGWLWHSTYRAQCNAAGKVINLSWSGSNATPSNIAPRT